MIIAEMTDNDWNSFEAFVKRNLVKSFVINKQFNKFWFRRKNGTWSIQLGKNDNGKIRAINMLIETKGKICGKLSSFSWAGAAYADKQARKRGIFGLMMLNSHRNLPIMGLMCANKKSLPINEQLGMSIPNLKMRRFIYVHSFKCLQIVKKKYHSIIKKNLKFKKHNFKKEIIEEWSKNIPNGTDKIWSMFSKNFKICIHKDLNYFIKRYKKSPFQNYDILTFRNKKKKLLGVSIIRFQKTPHGICSRIVDFMSVPKYEFRVLHETIKECEKKKSLFSDFFVVGTAKDKQILNSGFQLATNKNKLDEIPNLLSPIENRKWSYTFHISGYLPRKFKGWKKSDKIWFTKGDGDRDWPTPHEIKNSKF